MTRKLLIALPKGRLLDKSIDLMGKAGITVAPGDGSRLLFIEDLDRLFRFVMLKPVDIPVYVESGVIDAGICGSDILRELESDVNEPLDLQIGRCALVVAGPAEKGSVLPVGISMSPPSIPALPHASSKGRTPMCTS